MPSPYRSSAKPRGRSSDDVVTELGKIVWGATLIAAWLTDLSWLIAASLRQAPIALDLAFAAFLVLVTGATIERAPGRTR